MRPEGGLHTGPSQRPGELRDGSRLSETPGSKPPVGLEQRPGRTEQSPGLSSLFYQEIES